MMRTWIILLSWLLGTVASPLHAAPLFEDQTPLEVELTGPLSALIKNKKDREERPFQLRSGSVELDVKVKARGNSRMRVCNFPPLRFNFKKGDTVGTPFEGQDKLKLVTRCKKADRYQADALEEYAAYRIFSLLTDASYRTRLVHMTYNDTDGRLQEAYRDSYGFLIEPLDQLVARLNGSLSELPAVALRQLDKEQAALVYVYQYLIANTDWSFVAAEGDEFCCHNIELVRSGNKHFPVPYDFDLAGLVNARYARPDSSLNISRVTKRLYRGFCTDTDTLRGALRHIVSKEDEILGVIAGLPILDEKEKADRIKYLGGFFKEARDEDKLIKMFEKRCHP
jgi:hypothetical protein